MPSQVAWDDPTGTGHEVHALPHELGLVSAAHRPPQLWVPGGQVPEQVWPASMHTPLHSVLPVGQAAPHCPWTQVAAPPVGAGQAVQDPPQVAGAVESTQAPLQAWNPVAQAAPQVPAMHVAVPFAAAAHSWQAGPHAEGSSSRTQRPPHLCNPVPQTKSQLLPSQVAWMAPTGTGQGVQDVPQPCSSSAARQRPEQACFPDGQVSQE